MKQPTPPKIRNEMDFSQYQRFTDLGIGYQYTARDMEALKWFIKSNMAVLADSDALEELETDSRIEVQLHVPKLSFEPITFGTIDFTYVVRLPATEKKGLYATYLGFIYKTDGSKDWSRANIEALRSDGVEFYDMAKFKPEDFQELGLQFVRKYKLIELPRSEQEKHYDDFVPQQADDRKIYSLVSPLNFAFYEFETVQNRHKLKLTFVVSRKRELENAESGLPLAWHKLYIERVD